MFKPRTQPVKEGETPFDWDTPTVYQCTWFGYFEAIRCGMSPATWFDRESKIGSYPNAKLWLENYRDPWEVKSPDWNAKAGDIAVFDGEYGHIQFLETDTLYAEYKNGDPDSFHIGKFEKLPNLLGFLHYPFDSVLPVDRNPAVDQIQTTDEDLRIRTAPSLSAEIVGHVQLGYYNVLQTEKADGYTWYEIAPDRWCGNVTVNFLPSSETEIIKEIEKAFASLKDEISNLADENSRYKDKLEQIEEIAKC